MASKEDRERTKVPSTSKGFTFELSEEQRKAVIECIRETGKLSVNLRNVGVSKLPGLGLSDDVEGELID
jgi:hypothetical protein